MRGQSESPSQTHMFINGASSSRYSLTVDWSLVAARVGTYRIGPATVAVGGARAASATFSVKVVPAGRRPSASTVHACFPAESLRFVAIRPLEKLLVRHAWFGE